MIRFLVCLGGSIITFAVLTLATAVHGSSFDANDTYGFPFTFYTVFGGKQMLQQASGFNKLHLIYDAGIAVMIFVLIYAVFSYLGRIYNKNGFREPFF